MVSHRAHSLLFDDLPSNLICFANTIESIVATPGPGICNKILERKIVNIF